jgi:hypothetical protein
MRGLRGKSAKGGGGVCTLSSPTVWALHLFVCRPQNVATSDWTFGPHLLNQHRVNARPRDGDHQNLSASSIWRSIITPDEIRHDPLAVVALSPENDDTIELFSLRLVDGHDLNAIWIIHSIENQILSESVVENVACARVG